MTNRRHGKKVIRYAKISLFFAGTFFMMMILGFFVTLPYTLVLGVTIGSVILSNVFMAAMTFAISDENLNDLYM
jgi:hypothetical protein